ncbi:Xaa-Pro peptidase family protein [bacterium]|nr:Xaa-Pro peptidase family protein [bacterium]
MYRIPKLDITEGMFYTDHPTDIYYLIGKKVSAGTLLVFPNLAVFFVDARYIDACKSIDGIEVRLAEKDALETFLKKRAPHTVLMDGKTVTMDRYKQLKEMLPKAKFISSSLMDKTRAVKDDNEVRKMTIAGALNFAGHKHAFSKLKEGITEKEVAWEYEKYVRTKGGECLSFETIVAFGENSAHPHHHTGYKKLEKGMPVLLDCGVTVDSYTSDMTRCTFFEKEKNPEDYALWKQHFDLVKESYDRAFERALIGEVFSSLDEIVQEYAIEKKVAKQVRHSLGHGLGLDIHEWPRLSHLVKDIIIEKNMVFTIEPGLYFEGKWGIRYENTIVASHTGPLVLSC